MGYSRLISARTLSIGWGGNVPILPTDFLVSGSSLGTDLKVIPNHGLNTALYRCCRLKRLSYGWVFAGNLAISEGEAWARCSSVSLCRCLWRLWLTSHSFISITSASAHCARPTIASYANKIFLIWYIMLMRIPQSVTAIFSHPIIAKLGQRIIAHYADYVEAFRFQRKIYLQVGPAGKQGCITLPRDNISLTLGDIFSLV